MLFSLDVTAGTAYARGNALLIGISSISVLESRYLFLLLFFPFLPTILLFQRAIVLAIVPFQAGARSLCSADFCRAGERSVYTAGFKREVLILEHGSEYGATS